MPVVESRLPSHAAPRAAPAGLGAGRTLLFATSVAVMVMNLFAVQTVAPVIAASLGLGLDSVGVLAMLPQLGYALGLVLLVPLADRLENRRLIGATLAVCALCMLAAAFAPGGAVFMAAVFAGGASTCAIQMLVPMAAFMAAPERRGATVGNVMSGLMVGVLLSRPLSNLVVDAWGWRALYLVFAGGMAATGVALLCLLPQRRPHDGPAYPALIASLAALLRHEPVLRWRAATAALGMAAYSLFWTAISLRLAQAPFHLGARAVAALALCGAVGVVTAPLAGRAGDRGHTRRASIAAQAVVVVSWLLAGWAGGAWPGTGAVLPVGAALAALTMAAILLDAGVTGDQTLGRRAVNLVRPEARGRMNGLFVGVFFVGSAAGSSLAGFAWSHGGWALVSAAGVVVGMAMLAVYLAAPRSAADR
ncbi:MFS transporter [Bordetella petrii]|uniref:Probable MFS permease n=1 Tax=Bordetella petrii (strain ATCC BAA-461 / DSM 12804 / CCUG 43448 / CIP 107267 / Se-1111R) TaxID=340100 RepID=A9HZC3_BORPD|nr:MFS transporter [Bordetella petrii]CAP43930.1 probable MFS permease [Bordetella petrii]